MEVEEIKTNRKNNKKNSVKTNQQKKIEKKLTTDKNNRHNKINITDHTKLENEQMELNEQPSPTRLSIPGRGIKLPNKIPESITSLDFENLTIPIPPGKLPSDTSTIKKIKFGRMYECELLPGSLPNGITDLTLGKSKIQLSVIPNTVTNLLFSDQFNNDIIPGSIPNSVTSISFLDCGLPIPIKKKDKNKSNVFHDSMAITSNILPPLNLQPNTITASVTFLDFGSYNCLLEPGVLPKSIKTLIFGKEYTREFSKGSIPDSVTNLTISHMKFIGSESIPSSVINLRFQDNFNKPIEPGTLQSASSLETLTFGRNFNSTIAPLSLPSSLKTIIFGYHHNQTIKEYVLPNSLTSLEFGYSQRERIDENLLPKSLINFKTGELYGIPFDYNIINDHSAPSSSSFVPCNNSWRDVLYDKGYNLD